MFYDLYQEYFEWNYNENVFRMIFFMIGTDNGLVPPVTKHWKPLLELSELMLTKIQDAIWNH